MLETILEKWDEILEYIRVDHELSEVSYKTWLLPIKPCFMDGQVLSILVPDENFLGYIKKKYSFLLQVGIEEITGIACQLDFITEQELKKKEKEKENRGTSSVEKPMIPRRETEASPSSILSANLNPRYTFDNFVVGKNNNFAHAAALAVAESPGTMYNPLFIYGGVGLGKTHLMHSIGHYILANNPEKRVIYLTTEQFTNEMIDAIRGKNNISTTEFREKYRAVDVLLVDDIQFIMEKVGTQEEFFHTFNALYGANKQIVLSSDKPPAQLATLEERLRSRFGSGLTVDIQSPDYETRMAILRKKEETITNIQVDNEVIKYIASNIKSNIRELEGALTKVIAYARINNCPITPELAEEALKDTISPNVQKAITPELIIQVVAEHYSVTAEDIISKKRSNDIVIPRQVAMYLCRNLTSIPATGIGKCLGGRDHPPVLYGHDKIAEDISKNSQMAETIDILIKKINTQ